MITGITVVSNNRKYVNLIFAQCTLMNLTFRPPFACLQKHIYLKFRDQGNAKFCIPKSKNKRISKDFLEGDMASALELIAALKLLSSPL